MKKELKDMNQEQKRERERDRRADRQIVIQMPKRQLDRSVIERYQKTITSPRAIKHSETKRGIRQNLRKGTFYLSGIFKGSFYLSIRQPNSLLQHFYDQNIANGGTPFQTAPLSSQFDHEVWGIKVSNTVSGLETPLCICGFQNLLIRIGPAFGCCLTLF